MGTAGSADFAAVSAVCSLLSRLTVPYWVHRRGAYSVKRPIAGITRRRDGIPFLAPEVVLLFKGRKAAVPGR